MPFPKNRLTNDPTLYPVNFLQNDPVNSAHDWPDRWDPYSQPEVTGLSFALRAEEFAKVCSNVEK